MTSPRQSELSKELIAKAERGQWNLECDERLLGSMQNVANKLESRSDATRSGIDRMMLNCDETGVKLQNLTRINSLQNKNYCENKIREDGIDEPDEVPRKEPVKLSQNIAIENGLKMLQNCFEKHQVQLDPSSGDSKTATVYRPIDKYSKPLPLLIGTPEWNEKWHVGLLDAEVVSQRPAPVPEHRPVTDDISSLHKYIVDEGMSARSSLRASQDSLATSSIGDQMVINQPVGLFDGLDEIMAATASAGPSSSFFRPQPEQRKIVNLFDDEPPSLDPSPQAGRRTVNMFDDYGSVDSFPSHTSETSEKPPPPPIQQFVDLFDDNEFDSFIRKIEQQEPTDTAAAQPEPAKREEKAGKLPVDMKKLSDEIKNFQLKKAADKEKIAQGAVPKKFEAAPRKVEAVIRKPEAVARQQEPEIRKPEPVITKTATPVKRNVVEVKEPPKFTKPAPKPDLEPKEIVVEEKPRAKKVTNLFDDDDDDQTDFFDEIIKQKAISKQSEVITAAPSKPKITKLFDDDVDDAFEEIFKKKSTVKSPEAGEPSKVGKKMSSLFDDDDVAKPVQTKTDTTKKKTTSLFDDDDESEIFEEKREVPEQVEKSSATEKQEIVENSVKNKRELMLDEENVAVKNISEVKEAVEAKISEPNREIVQDPPAAEVEERIATPKDEEIAATKDPVVESEPAKGLSSTLPFLSDVPPDDDADWDTEDHFEEPEPVTAKPSSFPTVPIFDELPPDDDFVPPAVPAPDFIESDDEPEPEKKILPIPEPEVKPEPKATQSKDEPDRSVVAGDKIKSKLDMLAKRAESKAPDPLLAKKAPGKLNMNMKINVGALMPGARLPSKAPVEVEAEEEESKEEKPKEVKSTDGEPKETKSKDSPPGKLNMNLKINVGALMPGARLPPKAPVEAKSKPEETKEEKSEEVRTKDVQKPEEQKPKADSPKAATPVSDSSPVHSPVSPKPQDPNNNSPSLLNNELMKSRSRIQIKRRPPTRRALQENYRKSLTMNTSDDTIDTDDDDDKKAESSTPNTPIEPLKKSFSSIFDEMRAKKEVKLVEKSKSTIAVAEKKIMSAVFIDDEPPPSEEASKPVQTNKISVFYDDEEDTRVLVEQRKKEMEVTLSKTIETKTSTRTAASMFDDDSDDDLFGKVKNQPASKVTKPATKVEQPAKVDKPQSSAKADKPQSAAAKAAKQSENPKQSSLFDDTSDDDLFTPKGAVKKQSAPATKKLFESDDDDEAETSTSTKPKAGPPKKQSLFGDDESDDDLFSSKPKSSSAKSASSISKSSVVKKQATAAVDDPLKDLLNN